MTDTPTQPTDAALIDSINAVRLHQIGGELPDNGAAMIDVFETELRFRGWTDSQIAKAVVDYQGPS